jgi:hypothetical protein
VQRQVFRQGAGARGLRIAAQHDEVRIARLQQQGVACFVLDHAGLDGGHTQAAGRGVERVQARPGGGAQVLEIGTCRRRGHGACDEGVVGPADTGVGAADKVGVEGARKRGGGTEAAVLRGAAVHMHENGLDHRVRSGMRIG